MSLLNGREANDHVKLVRVDQTSPEVFFFFFFTSPQVTSVTCDSCYNSSLANKLFIYFSISVRFPLFYQSFGAQLDFKDTEIGLLSIFSACFNSQSPFVS